MRSGAPLPELKKVVGDELRRAGLFTPASGLLVGVSGGADSVALLLTLAALRSEGGPRIVAAHCNFNLRGEESHRDEEFCRKLCQEKGIELKVASFDTRTFMKDSKLSLEMACRQLRYDYFASIIESAGLQRVAVAHNADDNAETLLLNLMRGAGIKGLKGMVSDTGTIFRPLLTVSKQQITDTLRSLGQEFMTDSTNLETDADRNFLRLRVIPLLEERWPQAKKMICRSADNLRREEMVINRSLSNFRPASQPFSHSFHPTILAISTIRESGDPLTAIKHFISPYGGSRAIAEEAADVIAAPGSHSGKWWRLSDRFRLSLERDRLEIIPATASLLPIMISEVNDAEMSIAEIAAKSNSHVIYLPLGPEEVEIRGMQIADRLHPEGIEGSVKVSKLMKDSKLSRLQKEQTPLVIDRASGEILWVAGLRRSRYAKVEPGLGRFWRYELREDSDSDSSSNNQQ